ncbi:MAG: hypothetical protein EOM41_06770 [Bacilli bacterium]|nr:hypothetical protein [Bacilli bacterium]
MLSFIFFISIVYLIVSIFCFYLLTGGGIYFKAKLMATPSFLIGLPCIAQYICMYLGINNFLSFSIIIFVVASDLFITESLRAEAQAGKMAFLMRPKIVGIFDQINTIVSFVSSVASYIILVVTIYYKYIK